MNCLAKNFQKIYFRDALAMLAVMLAVFFLTEKDVSASGIGLFVRKSIVCSLALCIAQAVVKERFFSKHWLLAHCLICWEYLYIFVQAVFINAGALGQIYENEIFLGSYGAIGFIFLQYIQENYVRNKFWAVFLDVPKAALTLIPVITVIHWLIYGYNITFEEMTAVQQTSFREAAEWLMVYVGVLPAIVLAVCLCAEMWFFYILRQHSQKNEYTISSSALRNKYFVMAFAVFAFYYPIKIIADSDWTGQYVHAAAYAKNISQYMENIDAKSAGIGFDEPDMISTKPHTVVVVIGESANRDKLHAYNEDYQYADTPWMEQNKPDEKFIFFSNAYACQSMTLQVLE